MPPSDFFSDRTTRRQEKRDRVFQQHQSERAKPNGPPRRRRSVRPPPPPPTPLPPSPPPSPPPPSTPRTTPTSASGGDEQDLSVSVLGDDEDEPPPPPRQFNNGDAVQGNSLIHFVSPSQTLAVHNLGLGLKLLQDGSVGGETDNDRTEFLSSEVKGKYMTTIIASGREKLASVPSGGAAAAEQKKEVKRKSVIRITTGSHGLDELLGGGIETFAIKEAFGGFRSGKTQLAHACVSTQALLTELACYFAASYSHGGNGKVAYLDTEGTLLPERLVPIAERFGLEPGAIFDNIVESLIALFRVDFTGKGELADRQMLSRLIEIAEEFNVQVIANPSGGVFISDSKKPAGGHELSHAATIRIIFRKGKGEQRVCKVFDAPKLSEAEGEPLYVALFRVDFTGRGELADHQILSRLIKIAEEFNVAVYITYQVIADPGGGVFISDPKKPAGGHVLAHAATIRLMFRKGKGEQCV